ncbi:hypothetical protein HDU97_005386 [Phlyctochytrium planicorne]|nr:hypothetical protein HDU97_005386 [Phlyctochytrium planicorne]
MMGDRFVGGGTPAFAANHQQFNQQQQQQQIQYQQQQQQQPQQYQNYPNTPQQQHQYRQPRQTQQLGSAYVDPRYPDAPPDYMMATGNGRPALHPPAQSQAPFHWSNSAGAPPHTPPMHPQSMPQQQQQFQLPQQQEQGYNNANAYVGAGRRGTNSPKPTISIAGAHQHMNSGPASAYPSTKADLQPWHSSPNHFASASASGPLSAPSYNQHPNLTAPQAPDLSRMQRSRTAGVIPSAEEYTPMVGAPSRRPTYGDVMVQKRAAEEAGNSRNQPPAQSTRSMLPMSKSTPMTPVQTKTTPMTPINSTKSTPMTPIKSTPMTPVTSSTRMFQMPTSAPDEESRRISTQSSASSSGDLSSPPTPRNRTKPDLGAPSMHMAPRIRTEPRSKPGPHSAAATSPIPSQGRLAYADASGKPDETRSLGPTSPAIQNARTLGYFDSPPSPVPAHSRVKLDAPPSPIPQHTRPMRAAATPPPLSMGVEPSLPSSLRDSMISSSSSASNSSSNVYTGQQPNALARLMSNASRASQAQMQAGEAMQRSLTAPSKALSPVPRQDEDPISRRIQEQQGRFGVADEMAGLPVRVSSARRGGRSRSEGRKVAKVADFTEDGFDAPASSVSSQERAFPSSSSTSSISSNPSDATERDFGRPGLPLDRAGNLSGGKQMAGVIGREKDRPTLMISQPMKRVVGPVSAGSVLVSVGMVDDEKEKEKGGRKREIVSMGPKPREAPRSQVPAGPSSSSSSSVNRQPPQPTSATSTSTSSGYSVPPKRSLSLRRGEVQPTAGSPPPASTTPVTPPPTTPTNIASTFRPHPSPTSPLPRTPTSASSKPSILKQSQARTWTSTHLQAAKAGQRSPNTANQAAGNGGWQGGIGMQKSPSVNDALMASIGYISPSSASPRTPGSAASLKSRLDDLLAEIDASPVSPRAGPLPAGRALVSKRASRDDFGVSYGKPPVERMPTIKDVEAATRKLDGMLAGVQAREGKKEGTMSRLDTLLSEFGGWDVEEEKGRRPSAPDVRRVVGKEERRPSAPDVRRVVGGEERRPSAPEIRRVGDDGRRPSTPDARKVRRGDERAPVAEDVKKEEQPPLQSQRGPSGAEVRVDGMARRPSLKDGKEETVRRTVAAGEARRFYGDEEGRRPSAPEIRRVGEDFANSPAPSSRRPSTPDTRRVAKFGAASGEMRKVEPSGNASLVTEVDTGKPSAEGLVSPVEMRKDGTADGTVLSLSRSRPQNLTDARNARREERARSKSRTRAGAGGNAVSPVGVVAPASAAQPAPAQIPSFATALADAKPSQEAVATTPLPAQVSSLPTSQQPPLPPAAAATISPAPLAPISTSRPAPISTTPTSTPSSVTSPFTPLTSPLVFFSRLKTPGGVGTPGPDSPMLGGLEVLKPTTPTGESVPDLGGAAAVNGVVLGRLGSTDSSRSAAGNVAVGGPARLGSSSSASGGSIVSNAAAPSAPTPVPSVASAAAAAPSRLNSSSSSNSAPQGVPPPPPSSSGTPVPPPPPSIATPVPSVPESLPDEKKQQTGMMKSMLASIWNPIQRALTSAPAANVGAGAGGEKDDVIGNVRVDEVDGEERKSGRWSRVSGVVESVGSGAGSGRGSVRVSSFGGGSGGGEVADSSVEGVIVDAGEVKEGDLGEVKEEVARRTWLGRRGTLRGTGRRKVWDEDETTSGSERMESAAATTPMAKVSDVNDFVVVENSNVQPGAGLVNGRERHEREWGAGAAGGKAMRRVVEGERKVVDRRSRRRSFSPASSSDEN